MERSYEKEKSSRKAREEQGRDSYRDQKDRDRERERESNRDFKHHRSRDLHHSKDRDVHIDYNDDENEHHRRGRHIKDDKHRRDDGDEYHRSRAQLRREKSFEEYQKSREELEDQDARRGREGSKDRLREQEMNKDWETVHKRKDRETSEDRSYITEKRTRVSDADKRKRSGFEDKADTDEIDQEERSEKDLRKGDRKVRKKFEDGLKEDDMQVKKESKEEGTGNHRTREKRRFEDAELKEETKVKEEFDGNSGSAQYIRELGSTTNVSSVERSKVAPQTSDATHLSAKVSSVLPTNENKGVSVIGSDEFSGKSSTDGAATADGKTGKSTLDVVAKAKLALQKKKELEERLKRLPLLNKVSGSKFDGSSQVSSKEGLKVQPAAGVLSTTPYTSAAMNALILPAASTATMKPVGGLDPARMEAMKRVQELTAKMGFRQDSELDLFPTMTPGHMPTDVSVLEKPKRPLVLRLDALGREIDEHGNVVNAPKRTNTLKVNLNQEKRDAFQILKPELSVDLEKNPHFDTRMGINKNKLLRPKKASFQFVSEGQWSREAEAIKIKNQFGEAQAKELKAKQAQLAKAKAEPNINPNLIEVGERVITKEKTKEPIPEVEWWDVPILRSGNYTDIADVEDVEGKIKREKITKYVEHPHPIEPPAEPVPPPPQPLKLTRKEQKKLRTQRRLAKEKERQEMIRQGLMEPPKPKVKMSNLMKVLGSEATQDPTRLEKEIRTAAAEREQAHVDRNIARKLTPAERREKKERKLFDDPNTKETIVSVYKINDLSDPKNRFKVDVNAQENRLTGCAVISDGFCIVVVEGGSKSIKRYRKLMLRRINWAAKMENEDGEEDELEEKPLNNCVLVWEGSVASPSFSRFLVQECRTENAARKVFADAGVGHYWDLAANFADDQV